jgi:lambda family phage minor tail protein L
MRDTKKYIDNIFELDPTTSICLYEINLKEKGEYLFHAGENGYRKPIIFDNKEYEFFPIAVSGFEMHGNTRLPRPKMTFSNHGGVISLRLNYFNDFSNHRVKRIKTFVKFIDDVNFPNNENPYGEADPDVMVQEEIFYVNQKTQENDSIVEFELVSLLELENASIPNRKVFSNNCSWNYRSSLGCGYTGRPIADFKNKKIVNSGYSGPRVGAEAYFPEEEKLGDENWDIDSLQSWDPNAIYNKGDIVKVISFSNDSVNSPPGLYICKEDGVASYPPRDRHSWIVDDCDKTMCGCKLRFSDAAESSGGCQRNKKSWKETLNGLPFGGFPGVEPYDSK